MSRDAAFIERWHRERDVYQAWGNHISHVITDALTRVIPTAGSGSLLKLPATPRLKDDLKLVEKAFYRKKAYADPFEDIHDKVGTRFVVLLSRDIRSVAEAVESKNDWTFSRDRDYEEEQKVNPVVFDYAAVHYVVRPKADFNAGGLIVPAGTPCEVQIKTILQHAYSELTHDTIYKPQIQATPAMRRGAAKAMALLEATNDYFEQVAAQVASVLSSVQKITAELSVVYKDATGLDPSPSALEGFLLEAYESQAQGDYRDRAARMLAERRFLAERVKARVADRNPLFSQPSVLLAYLDIAERGRRAARIWPLTPAEMEPLLNDFGESIY